MLSQTTYRCQLVNSLLSFARILRSWGIAWHRQCGPTYAIHKKNIKYQQPRLVLEQLLPHSVPRIFSISSILHRSCVPLIVTNILLDHVGEGGDSQGGGTVAEVRDSGQRCASALASVLGSLRRLGGRRGAASGGRASTRAAALSRAGAASLLLGRVLGAAVVLDGGGAVVLSSLATDVGKVAYRVGLFASELHEKIRSQHDSRYTR